MVLSPRGQRTSVVGDDIKVTKGSTETTSNIENS